MKRSIPCIAVVLLVLSATGGSAADFAVEDIEFFETRVRPLLAEHCYECHSAESDSPEANLRLDSRDAFLAGGDNGPAIAPGAPEQSRLVRAISYQDIDLQMPPDGKLPEEAIALLTEWVRRGAPWPEEERAEAPAAAKAITFDLLARKQAHWAWRPISPPALPEVRDSAWPRSDIDHFILARLEERGLAPAPVAERGTWLRRVTFDLVGLPPSVEELAAFIADESPEAHERVVDRLLSSPHFGERWARHWLDLVRYADTKGHEFDYPAPNAWQYRDYVIRALNADVPYDQFVTEHIAGDLLAAPRLHATDGFNESILGTGFWFLGEEVHSPVDTRQDQADRFDNRIDVMGKAFLGLTVACARCHDHKFDALSSRDYYALFGVLESTSYRLARFDTMERDKQIARRLDDLRSAAQPELRRLLAQSLRPGVERIADYLLAADAGKVDSAVAASTSQLNAKVRAAWVAHLTKAAGEPDDPFHAWTQRSAAAKVTTSDYPVSAVAIPSNMDVVVDYSQPQPGQWLPDDVGYGFRPRRTGEMYVSGSLDDPRLTYADRTAAVFDRFWDARTLAPGSELESGAISKVVRPGRTLNTPSFRVRGKVFSLVRGAGQVYAAVDAHVMIQGPLHGVLVGAFDSEGQWRWVERDLTDYVGHPAHLEFTPAHNAELAIAAVVQADQSPALSSAVAEAVNDTATPDELTAAYQRQFAEAIQRLERTGTTPGDNASGSKLLCEEDARLIGWAIEHPALFFADGELPVSLQDAVRRQLQAEQQLASEIKPESRLAMAMLDGAAYDERLFVRGSPRNLGDVVPRRFLEALAGPVPLRDVTGSGRLELARQMTDPALDPFLPRVLVNRVWRHLFGRGIVASVDNFGVVGEAPTHPELLDHLADRFVREGWSIKRLIRALALSNAYRMASQGSEAAETLDPQNLLWHRMNVRRLDGEAIRDAMLAISGRLDCSMYGPGVPVHLTEFMEGRGRPATSGPLDGAGRRSVYTVVRRNFLSPMMLAFDTPVPFSTVGRRSVSNVPAQSLVLLNDPLVHELAAQWAHQVCAAEEDAGRRVERMYLAAFSRPPRDDERAACLAYVERQAQQTGCDADDVQVWKELAHALWNVKEFVYVSMH